MNRFSGVRILFGFLIFFGILVGAVWLTAETELEYEKEDLYAYFLQTKGDADCTVLLQDKYCAIIDTGERQDESSILEFLEEKKVEKISYLILTHPDADHIGNARAILERFEVKVLIVPYYEKENEELEKIYEVCVEKNVRRITPIKGKVFMAGRMNLSVLPPLEKKYGNDNNYSLAVTLKHKAVSMVFAGDAVEKRTQELMNFHWQKTDVYKVPYHGRDFKGTDMLLEQINPKVAIVTAQRADNLIEESCQKLGSSLYCTGDGMITVYSDGEKIEILE